MTRQERAEVGKMLLVLAENVNQEISTARAKVLLDELSRFDFERVKAALAYLMRSCRFFPSLAEILDALGATPDSEADQIKAQAEAQWLRLLNMPNGASYHRVFLGRDANGEPIHKQPEDTLDPVARVAYRAMGESKAEWTEKNLEWKRKAFLELYQHHAKGPLALPAPKSAKVIEMARRIG